VVILNVTVGRDSVVVIATSYGPRSNPGWGGGARFATPVQTSPGVQPTSYTIGTGSFPGLREEYCCNSTPLRAFVARSRVNFTFLLDVTTINFYMPSYIDEYTATHTDLIWMTSLLCPHKSLNLFYVITICVKFCNYFIRILQRYWTRNSYHP